MKIAIYTLGCKVNQYETQAMEQELRRRGHQVVPFEEAADAYVVNSCSVTAVSDRKSRQMLYRVRREHPQAVLALCGCYSQTHPEDVEQLDVDLIAGTGDRTGFLDLLERETEERRRLVALDNSFDRREFEVLPAGGLEDRTRCLLKVEDGCVNFCSYCIIPYARGRVRSLPLDRAAELQKAYLSGCVGETYPVLFEQPKDGWFFGHAPNYAEVLVKGEDLHNQIRPVTITSADGEFLYGTIKE